MTGDTTPDLLRTAQKALDWLSGHRDDFRLGDGALEPDADVNKSWKPLGELAQMCACIRRHTPAGTLLHDTASDLLHHAWNETDDGKLLLTLHRLEPHATYPLEVYAAFASGGLRHPAYEDFTARLVRSRSWRTAELLPNRVLSILNSERRCGLTPHEDASAVLRRTWLGGLPEPWAFERFAGYTLTHVVYHLTDWGRDPAAVPADIADYLATWLPAWLDTCVESRHWDLCGELLAVAASLPEPPPPDATESAWRALAQAQDPTGAVPEVGHGPHGEDIPRVFVNCYHSTTVTAFAATLTAARRAGADGRDSDGTSRGASA
ncbi:DUF6895 family protein [Streptomyces lavendofoliae]|uniref:DUF6895 domain-containing protein n=1 Tax=Streptomyces lavendofoliae TaxID=67314 RepID=A0A918HX58_9ACTN|nr:hypothetical protein [Streptomyces lavendofoliae]GGU39873.1 hypothetical protein GCM10010274_29420 [Streptomyces lavendofoliae]